MCGATRCAVAYSSGAGAAEVYDGEVAAEQMRCKPERLECGGCAPDTVCQPEMSIIS